MSCPQIEAGLGAISMKMVYDEWYGELSYAQRAAYRKYNVSPSDHNDLTDQFGSTNHKSITDAVKAYSPNGMFSSFAMWEDGTL